MRAHLTMLALPAVVALACTSPNTSLPVPPGPDASADSSPLPEPPGTDAGADLAAVVDHQAADEHVCVCDAPPAPPDVAVSPDVGVTPDLAPDRPPDLPPDSPPDLPPPPPPDAAPPPPDAPPVCTGVVCAGTCYGAEPTACVFYVADMLGFPVVSLDSMKFCPIASPGSKPGAAWTAASSCAPLVAQRTGELCTGRPSGQPLVAELFTYDGQGNVIAGRTVQSHATCP